MLIASHHIKKSKMEANMLSSLNDHQTAIDLSITRDMCTDNKTFLLLLFKGDY